MKCAARIKTIMNSLKGTPLLVLIVQTTSSNLEDVSSSYCSRNVDNVYLSWKTK